MTKGMDWDRVKREQKEAALRRRDAAVRRRGTAMRRPFPAKYPGRCTLCGDRVNVGDLVVMWSRPKIAHKGCAPVR